MVVVIYTHATGQFNITHHCSCCQWLLTTPIQIFSAVICIWAPDTDQCTMALLFTQVLAGCSCSNQMPYLTLDRFLW